MSSRTESDDFGQSLLDVAEDWYHVPALLLAVVWMFWIRMQNYSRFIRDGQVYFSGNDAWYHLRETNYVVRHFPSTMPFDPWTGFPTGIFVGQFGTLYDQLIALAALVIGLGSPSDTLIAKTLLVAPPVFGALAVIPVYFLGKRFSNRLGGMFGVLIIALLPGTFLRRTLVGAADHNAAEPLFMGFAVLGLLAAFNAATRTMPVWEVVEEELIENREPETLKEPLAWSLLGGFLTGLFIWVWPPAVFLVGIVGLFAAVNITSDIVNENTPEPVAFAVAVSMGVVALMSLLTIDTFGFSTTKLSLLQPITALAAAGGAVFLCWLARYWEQEDLSTSLYPAAVLGIAVVGMLFLAVAASSIYNLITGNLLRIVGFSAGAATRTIGEAQPFLNPSTLRRYGVGAAGRITLEYGLTFFTGLFAVVVIHGRPLVRKGTKRAYYYLGGTLFVVALIFASPVLGAVGDAINIDPQVLGLLIVAGLLAGATLIAEYDPEELFFVVWAAFITSMAFTQVRFNYYLAVVVAVANAFIFARVLDWVDLTGSLRTVTDDIQGYQVLAVTAALLLIVAPVLAVPITLGGTAQGGGVRTSTAAQAGNSTAPGAILGWEGTFDWMQKNTPEEGNLEGAGNADQMDYYGKYERTDDFQYPDGAYGVMSWWDYGHWITTQSQRIPNANPFQQGATNAANFLLAPNESQAQRVLNEEAGETEETRYVMVDWQMASTRSKFGAPTVFYDEQNVSSEDFYENVWVPRGNGAIPAAQIYSQRYYESMMVRLYRYHGSAQEAAPIVTDWEERTYQTATGEDVTLKLPPQGENESMVKQFDNMSAARQYVQEDGSASVGGVGPFPSEDVAALQHYRLVKASETQNRRFFSNEQRQAQLSGNPLYQLLFSRTTPSWVKTFEKVPGATLEGSGAPPNTEVTATVQMKMPSTNSTFTYQQHAMSDEDGEFTMVLPYSTTGYDNFGPENGYTNVSVRANSTYVITTPTTTNESGYDINYGQEFDVSEAKVLGVNESTKQVTLEKKTKPPGAAKNNTSKVPNTDYTIDPTAPSDTADALASSVDLGGSATAPAARDAGAVVAPARDAGGVVAPARDAGGVVAPASN